MLSYIDCECISGLTTQEIAAISRHMEVPAIIAVEIGANLRQTGKGRELIERLTLTVTEKDAAAPSREPVR